MYELSDHLIQFLILEGFFKERNLPEINLFKRNYSNFTDREFEETVINGVNWDEVCNLDLKDPSISVKNFYDTIHFHLDEMAPLKKVTVKEYRLMTKPWITKDILKK